MARFSPEGESRHHLNVVLHTREQNQQRSTKTKKNTLKVGFTGRGQKVMETSSRSVRIAGQSSTASQLAPECTKSHFWPFFLDIFLGNFWTHPLTSIPIWGVLHRSEGVASRDISSLCPMGLGSGWLGEFFRRRRRRRLPPLGV